VLPTLPLSPLPLLSHPLQCAVAAIVHFVRPPRCPPRTCTAQSCALPCSVTILLPYMTHLPVVSRLEGVRPIFASLATAFASGLHLSLNPLEGGPEIRWFMWKGYDSQKKVTGHYASPIVLTSVRFVELNYLCVRTEQYNRRLPFSSKKSFVRHFEEFTLRAIDTQISLRSDRCTHATTRPRDHATTIL
jgi:hypothetical protein